MQAQSIGFGQVKGEWPTTCAEATGLVTRLDDQPLRVRDKYYTHTDFQALYVVRRGRGIHVIDGVPYGVSRGDTYVMAAGATHAYSRHNDLSLDAIYFDPLVHGPVLRSLSGVPGFCDALAGAQGASGKWLHLAPAPYSLFRAQFEELRREWQSGSPEGAMVTHALFLRLIITLCRASHDTKSLPIKRGHADVAVSDVVRILDERFAQPIRILDVAREVGICADHLTVVFSKAMGRTPQNYLQHVRIERVKVLLRQSSLPMSEIAVQTGFSDAPHLLKTFAKIVGQTPGQFRRMAQLD